jgi:hypothetical protein
MEYIDDEIGIFLKRYETNANIGTAEEIVSQFAEVFMAADPSGARPVPASVLLAAVPQRKKLFESMGSGVTTLASLEQTRLDDRYILLKTEWLVKFDRGNGRSEELRLRSTFIVQRFDDRMRIVFYLNHEDLTTVLREKGLLALDKT